MGLKLITLSFWGPIILATNPNYTPCFQGGPSDIEDPAL